MNPAYQLQEAEYALRKVGDIHIPVFLLLWPHRRLHDIKVNHLLLFSQVGCKAIVCHSQFKTQRYCDMLRQICPEIESSSPGGIKSARYCCVTCDVMIITLCYKALQNTWKCCKISYLFIV